MKQLCIILMICSITLQVESARKNQRTREEIEDKIVFNDNDESSIYGEEIGQRPVKTKPVVAVDNAYDQQRPLTNVHNVQSFDPYQNIPSFNPIEPKSTTRAPVSSYTPNPDYTVRENNNFPEYAPTTTKYDTKPSFGYNGHRLNKQNLGVNGQSFNVSAAVGNFAVNMMKYANQGQSGNLVISPYSVAINLAVLQQGARGDTQHQISAALQMYPEVTPSSFKQLADKIKKRSGHNILNVANSIFPSHQLKLNTEFKMNTINNFDCEVLPNNYFDTAEAVKKINKWVATKTNHKIDQLLSQDSVDSNTQLVLVNAIHFKGLWQTKFRPNLTVLRQFHLKNKQEKTIDFMRARRLFRIGIDEISKVKVVILPFEAEEYSLMVLLPPSRSTVDEVIATLTYDQLARYHNFEEVDVDLEIPKFSIRSDTDLNPILRQMGVTNIFGPRSDLSRIGNYEYSNIPPQVSSAIHTAKLSIDEQGGTADAATSFTVVALSYDSPELFKADRPFVSILWDTKLALPLFMAKIEDPTL